MLPEIECKYYSTDKLPQSCHGKINSKLLERFFAGKEYFFEGFKDNFIEMYQFFCNECSDLFIVQVGGDYYHWGIASDDKYIFSAIPKTPRDLNVRISEKPYYLALPDFLKPFYSSMSGLDVSQKEMLSLHENGFLLSFPNWHDLNSLKKYKSQDSEFISFLDRTGSTDYRIIFRSLENQLVFLDLSTTSSKLLIADWDDFSTLRELENPIDFFTKSFFNLF